MVSEDVELNLDLKQRRETIAGLQQVERSVDSVGDQAESAGRQASRGARGFDRLGRAGKLAGAAAKVGFLAVAAAGYAAIKVGVSAFAEADEARKVGAQTNAVIKSTGAIAGVSAKHVNDLSSAISNKIGVDDESIAAGQNMLLTFTNVRNEVGKGNRIFDKATRTASDLAAAFGGDATSNSKLLGKALNDPVKGLSALTRVGVSFTKQQQDQIKALVTSGDVLGAQKVMLGEVQKQVQGSAKAQVTWGDKAKVAWGNLLETIGTKFYPVVTKVMRWVTKTGIPAIEAFGPVLDRVGRWFSDTLVPAIESLGPTFTKVKGWLSDAVGFVKGFFNSTGGKGGASKITELRDTVVDAFQTVKSVIRDAVVIVRVLWDTFGADIMRAAKTAFSAVLGIIRGAFMIVRGIFAFAKALLTGDWKGMWEAILTILSGVWQVIKNVVTLAFNAIRLYFTVFAKVVIARWKLIWDGVSKLLVAAWDGIKSLISGGWNWIKSKFTSGAEPVRRAWSTLWNGFKGVISKVIGAIKTIINGVIGTIQAVIDKITGAINKAKELAGIGTSGSTDTTWVRNMGGDSAPVTPSGHFAVEPRAKGGRARKGFPYVIGEDGPEVFSPDASGTVIPNHRAFPTVAAPARPVAPDLSMRAFEAAMAADAATHGDVAVQTHVQVVMPDGRVLADAVFGDARRRLARA